MQLTRRPLATLDPVSRSPERSAVAFARPAAVRPIREKRKYLCDPCARRGRRLGQPIAREACDLTAALCAMAS